LNRKPRREFVWSYGASDSAGEKRDRSEEHRGREIMRRDWDHDEDEDFHQHRQQGTRRHRSLSGWARSSRCRGGVEDCYSSSGRNRPSTPFRRRGEGMGQTTCWMPKVKNKVVSFADPIVSDIWPTDVSKGQFAAESPFPSGDMENSTQAVPETHAAANSKVNTSYGSVIADALIPPWAAKGVFPSPVPIVSGSQPTNVAEQVELCYKDAQAESNVFNIQSNSQWNDVVVEDRQLILTSNEGPTASHNTPGHFTPLPIENQLNSNDNLQIFIESITNIPEPSLIHSPPNRNRCAISPVVRGSDNLGVNANKNIISTGKRSSGRLAAKQKLKIGGSRDAISKAQEILIAKLNNSAAIQYKCSSASTSNNHVNLTEQIESLFAKPLNKEQMEAIMELANQGKGKKGSRSRGSKVSPLKAPIIEVVPEI
jgi:hypothetical protein